jgi:hypothetical protein
MEEMMLNKFSRKHSVATPKLEKEEYGMHDGIPIWKHLKYGGVENKINLRGIDYGSLAEQIGIREIKSLIRDKCLLKIFPNVMIISLNRKRQRSYGDYCLEISYKKDNIYGKKVLIIEIKHGKIEISQQQIKRYSNYVVNPSAYFRKSDEVKVYFMLFTKIDTLNSFATYTLCEFNKSFASKIVDAIPIQKANSSDLFTLFDNIK